MSKKDIGKWAENAYYDLLKGSYVETSKIVLYPFLKTLSRIHIDNNDTEDIYPCSEKDVQEIRAVLHGEKAFDFRVEMAVPLQVYNMFSEKSYFNFEKREKIKMIKNDILCNPQHISINSSKLCEYINSCPPIANDTLLDILEDHIVKLCRNLSNTDICLKEKNNLKLYPIKTNRNYLLEKLIDYLDCYLGNRNFNILVSYRNGIPDILLLV